MAHFNVIVGEDYSYPKVKRQVTAPDPQAAYDQVKSSLSGNKTVCTVYPVDWTPNM